MKAETLRLTEELIDVANKVAEELKDPDLREMLIDRIIRIRYSV